MSSTPPPTRSAPAGRTYVPPSEHPNPSSLPLSSSSPSPSLWNHLDRTRRSWRGVERELIVRGGCCGRKLGGEEVVGGNELGGKRRRWKRKQSGLGCDPRTSDGLKFFFVSRGSWLEDEREKERFQG